jgi:hypothetical protein
MGWNLVLPSPMLDLRTLTTMDALAEHPNVPGRWMIEKYRYVAKQIVAQCPAGHDIIVSQEMAAVLTAANHIDFWPNYEEEQVLGTTRKGPGHHRVILALAPDAPAVEFRRNHIMNVVNVMIDLNHMGRFLE